MRLDELIRCDEKAVKWRAEKEKQAQKNWMLHTGQIQEDYQQLLSDQGRFDELLALRREFARQQVKPKVTPTAAPKKAAAGKKKPKKPAQ